MKCIIKIGHDEILLPDDVGCAALLKCLSRGIRVQERLYKGQVMVLTERRPMDLSMSYVPASTKFVTEEESPIPDPLRSKPKKGQVLLLEDRHRA